MSGIVAIRVDNGDRATPRDTKSYGAYRAVAKAIQRQGNVPVPLHVVSSFNDMTDVMQRHGQERILFGVLDEETLGDKFTEAVDHLKREKGTPILTIAARGKDPYTQIDPEFALHRPL